LTTYFDLPENRVQGITKQKVLQFSLETLVFEVKLLLHLNYKMSNYYIMSALSDYRLSASLPTLKKVVTKVAGKLSLRTIIIVSFVLQLVGSVGLVGYLFFRNEQKGDLDLMLTLIAQIRQENDPLANALADLANKFQFEQLLALTQPTVSEP
jgi:hypothetical protein